MKTPGSLIHNTLWNLIGMSVPTMVAIATIPFVIGGLGTERFGVLGIGWAVMSYFALFDLGLGQATTKYVSEYLARENHARLPDLVWSSFAGHVVLGLAGGGLLLALAPLLTYRVFNLPSSLHEEALHAFILLAVSVPLIVTTACLRGVLEAMHRFDLVNLVKIPASSINYLGPLLVLQFSDSLPAVIAFIVASRGIVAAIYLLFCLKILPVLAKRFCVDIVLLRPLIGFGGWATASNLVAPVINLIDRFFIAAIISMTAVAYYVTPYEVVTKLWIFSASLMGAMFPVFSALAVHRQHEIRDLGIRAFQYLLFFVSPIVGVLITFARELLTAWISAEFGYYSAAVAKWLAFGVLVNVLAQVPYTILMSTGRASTVAKLQLAELPIYFAMVWYMVGHLGQVGAAMAWTVRACLDALIMGLVADKMLPAPETRRLSRSTVYKAMVIAVFLVLCFALDSALRTSPVLKALVFIPSLTLFVVWEWTILLGHAEHQQMLTWFYRMIGARR